MNRPEKTATSADIAALKAAQDAAAAVFWAYPDKDWQARFQAKWLRNQGFAPLVVVEGIVWGEA